MILTSNNLDPRYFVRHRIIPMPYKLHGLFCSISKPHAQIIDLCFDIVAANIKCLQNCLLSLCNGMIQSVYIIAIMTGGIGPGNKPKKDSFG